MLHFRKSLLPLLYACTLPYSLSPEICQQTFPSWCHCMGASTHQLIPKLRIPFSGDCKHAATPLHRQNFAFLFVSDPQFILICVKSAIKSVLISFVKGTLLQHHMLCPGWPQRPRPKRHLGHHHTVAQGTASWSGVAGGCFWPSWHGAVQRPGVLRWTGLRAHVRKCP